MPTALLSKLEAEAFFSTTKEQEKQQMALLIKAEKYSSFTVLIS
jgi:hypothetical protein